MQKLKKFFGNFYNIYLSGLTLLVSLPILAPITLALGLTWAAKPLYFIYSFFCHQFAYRSIHLFDYQFAWCARDTGIWIGIWLTALLIKFNKIKGIRWYWVIPFVVPIALDGGLQTIFTILNVSPSGALDRAPLYMSNNLVRFLTGAIFGIGISLWLSPVVKSDSQKIEDQELEIVDKKATRFRFYNLRSTVLLILAIFPIYLGLVGLWDLTSTKNDPIPPIDFVVKTPEDKFFTRREDAICPTTGVDNFLNFECFF